MKKLIILAILLLSFAAITSAQRDQKVWTDWSKDDVTKMLDKSAWGHVITNTDTSEMTVTMGQSQTDQGSRNQAISWSYHVRFFSAKPIRQAFARKVLMDNPSLKPQQLQGFVDGDYSDSIVIAVAYEATDRRYLAEREKAFNNATVEQIGRTVFLELRGGKQIPLSEYQPSSKDGTGAKFVFPRANLGVPYITDEKEVIRFVCNMSNGVEFEYRFKLSDMVYDGKLEY